MQQCIEKEGEERERVEAVNKYRKEGEEERESIWVISIAGSLERERELFYSRVWHAKRKVH